MTAIWSGTSEDAQYRYRITAQATSASSVAIAEMKQNKDTQQVTNATYVATDVVVLNDQLRGTVHLPGFATESIAVTRGPNNAVTIATGGLFFGLGAQTLGPFVLSELDYSGLEAWENENFPHN